MEETKANSRYRLVESLYQAAVDLPPDRRAGFIAEKCSGDTELRIELESLLEHYDLAENDYLAEPVHRLSTSGRPAPVPKRIGRYAIVRAIAEGGMGTVFEARQENPLRSVAVKVIRSGLPSADSLRRFDKEAQILGQLQHPGIAHIYDAGMADVVSADDSVSRQPFFAMEFVQGKPLNEYSQEPGLTLGDRLRLFIRICDAVDYAHQSGVIHRDLKPANILITRSGEPKILDFGVARMIDSNVQATTAYTELSQVVGTLPYMSPEQVDQGAQRIDVRSDVYSLGVILYQLIAGRLPYDLSGMPITRAARVIVEDSPASLGSLNRDFRGDLETIVSKVLEKEPDQRYQTVAALAADVGQYLRSEPISARPAGTIYQVRKFAQRNPALVISIMATFVALLAGVVGTTTFALRERAQAANARHRAAQAQAVTGFLRDMVATVDPANARGTEVTVRDALDEAARRLTTGNLQDNPEVEVALRQTIGETYNSLGHYALAARQLEAAMKTFGPLLDSPEAIDCLAQLAISFQGLGQYDEAERRKRTVLAKRIVLYGVGHPRVAEALEQLAGTLEKVERNDESKSLGAQALAIRRNHSEDDPLSLARSLSMLGVLHSKLGDYDNAESMLQEAIEILRDSLPADHPELAASISNLGSLYYQRGKNIEAEKLLTEAVEIRERVLEHSHPDLLDSMNKLAVLLIGLGKEERAITLLKQVVDTQRSTLGSDHPDLGKSLLSLAFALLANTRWDEAQQAGEEGIENIRRAFGDRHPDVATGLHNLAVQYMRLGQLDRALPMIQECTDIIIDSYGEDHPLTAHCRDTLGTIYLWQGRYDQAVEQFEIALTSRREKLGPDHGKFGITCKNMASARLGRGEYAAAAEAAKQAIAILKGNDALFMEYNDAVLVLAESQIRLGDATDEVEKGISEATQALKSKGAPWWMVAEGKRVMGLWLAERGQLDDAKGELFGARELLDCDEEINPFACEVVLRRIDKAVASMTN